MKKCVIVATHLVADHNATITRVSMRGGEEGAWQYVIIEMDQSEKDIYLEVNDQIHSAYDAIFELMLNAGSVRIVLKQNSNRYFDNADEIVVLFKGDGGIPVDVVNALESVQRTIHGNF